MLETLGANSCSGARVIQDHHVAGVLNGADEAMKKAASVISSGPSHRGNAAPGTITTLMMHRYYDVEHRRHHRHHGGQRSFHHQLSYSVPSPGVGNRR
ncbi:unnamed protein product [Linum trigynum]